MEDFLRLAQTYNCMNLEKILETDTQDIVELPDDELDYLMEFLLKFRTMSNLSIETYSKIQRKATDISNAMVFGVIK